MARNEKTQSRFAEYARTNRVVYEHFRASGCQTCGESRPECLAAHHIYGKKHTPAQMVSSHTPRSLISELLKCICLCQNCHALHHVGKNPVGMQVYIRFLGFFLMRLKPDFGHVVVSLRPKDYRPIL